jgi:hypothetical protein
MQNYENLLTQNSDLVKMMLLSCEEMQKDSLPDFTADYWEEKNHIQQCVDILNQEKQNMVDFKDMYDDRDN